MGIKTDIEWCDSSVNPTENCDGCELWNSKLKIKKCYAGKLVERWGGNFDGPIRLKPGRMAATLKWPDLTGTKRPDKPWLNGMPRVIFVGDMADVFSKAVPFEYIEKEALETARQSPHIYLMLTKQAGRLAQFVQWFHQMPRQWPRNVWVGVSVTGNDTLSRVKALRGIPTRAFVSYGPALEKVDFGRLGEDVPFDWMVIEGESGRGDDVAMLETSTVMDTLAWCRANRVTPFVKQMGTAWAQQSKTSKIHFKGGDPSAWPTEIRVREMPATGHTVKAEEPVRPEEKQSAMF